jgi:translation initiation factor IF-2
MPVRIYEIAKQLGIESKAVLAKAKDLGIAAAKVPSSSLDKITAEYLVEQMGGKADTGEPTPEPVPLPEIKVISQLPPEPIPEPEPLPEVVEEPTAETVSSVEYGAPASSTVSESAETETAPFTEGIDASPATPELKQSVHEESAPSALADSEMAPNSEAPKPVISKPAPPVGPRLGEKVGFIQLPTRPAPRPVERPSEQRPPDRSRVQPGGQPAQRPGQRPGQVQQVQRPGQFQRGPGGQSQGRGGNFGRNDRGAAGGWQRGGGQPVAPAAPKVVDPRNALPADAKVIIFKPPVTVRELAERLGLKPFQLIADLMGIGVFATVTQTVEENAAIKVCAKHGVKFEIEKRDKGGGVVHSQVQVIELDQDDKPESLKPRPPVVTIMGHVDHGKTSLLDVIRKANVVAGEAGGITQHIGAYTISFPHPEKKQELQQITFLDTPGHAAFSAMRARGADVTDIVVLVVAATDGVMPQTLEALSHAKAAGVPVLVAVNKCDHPNANPLKVRQQLQDKGLVPDDWGGDTIYVDCSAVTKQGVDKLLEMIILQADLLELKANPERNAKGNVIESGLEPGGPTVTVLVRKGTLRVGDVVICDHFFGKVRALISEDGQRLKEAGPSHAVKVLGLNGVPGAGLEFSAVENEKAARNLAEEREMVNKAGALESRAKVTLENLFATLDANQAKVLRVVVKADTQGSLEAICDALNKIDSTKVSLDIIHSAVGTVTESDVLLSSASKCIVIGFHTRIDNGVSDVAKREGVQIKLYSIIYELVDEVRDAMAGLLDPILKETVVGAAEVRKIFALSKGGNVAGCAVTMGRIVRGKVRVMRRKNRIYEGVTQSLRRFQDEVNEVRAGMECGIRLEGFDDFQEGDSIETYSVEKVAQKL